MLTESALVTPLLSLASQVYGGLVSARNHLYSGILPVRRLPRPVISVGNLTVGGTGKTSLVIHLAGILLEMGAVPAILSRGYRRSGQRTCTVIPPAATVRSPADVLGDEPALIRRAVRQAWLGLAPSRYQAGLSLFRECPKAVFLLDDGFQHRGLHRELDLLVLDATQPLLQNRLLPRGTLREPVAGISRANALVIHQHLERTSEFEAAVRKFNSGAAVFHARRRLSGLVSLGAWKKGEFRNSRFDPNQRVYLVASIGNPGRFLGDIERSGLTVRGRRFFRDHYRPSAADWESCIDDARRSGADAIVITEKDAIKTSDVSLFPTLVCTQEVSILERDAVRALLRPFVENSS